MALESAARGVGVHLIESNAQLMGEASGHNEGKIHLGFVYANDLSFQTVRPAGARALGLGLEKLRLELTD